MKKQWKILIAIFALVILFATPILFKQQTEQVHSKETKTTKAEQAACPILIQVEGVDEAQPLEQYVKGVIAGEMPVSFHEEALKAQALAARTYALKMTNYGEKPIAKDVSAQVYLTEKERKKRWGKAFKEHEKKVEQAVQATEGEVIIFEDELITAMFFATSNGQTEDIKNFSGTAIPYLQSVESKGEEKITPTFVENNELSLAEWNTLLGDKWDQKRFETLQLIRNASGRVQEMVADNFKKTGREVREQLGLRSTDFNIAFDVDRERVLIETVGYGHGVGLSQYGAEAYAQAGKTADEIIRHYYTGVTTKKIEKDAVECLKTP